jgi:hypothetical protein
MTFVKGSGAEGHVLRPPAEEQMLAALSRSEVR